MNDEITITRAQAITLWRLCRAARAIAPVPPPQIPSAARGSAYEDHAIRAWHRTIRASGEGVEDLAVCIAEVDAAGAGVALERIAATTTEERR